jgi:hypothetical protein
VLDETISWPRRLLSRVDRCDTVETKYRHRELGPITTDVDETLRERWRGIGYIGSPSSTGGRDPGKPPAER